MAAVDRYYYPQIPEPDYGNDSDSSRPSSPTRDYPENLNDSPDNTLTPNYQASPRASPRTSRRPVSPVPPVSPSRPADANPRSNNAAYKLHLKNHLKYATVKNVANYNDCPICQQFGKGEVYAPPQRPPRETLPPEKVFPGANVFIRSPNTPRRPSRAQPIYNRRNSVDSSDDQMGYFKEVAEPDAIYFKVTRERRALAAQELSVVKNEFLRIIDGEGNWWACENKYGYAGYVPRTILQPASQDAFQNTKSKQTQYLGAESSKVESRRSNNNY